MIQESDSDKIVALQLSTAAETRGNEELPFVVELWDAPAAAVERVIARAASHQLARAIFGSARKEFPERRITVRRNAEIMIDSNKP